MREIVFDTETTGFSYAGGDRLVEIGAVELHHRIPTGRVFHRYCNPGRPMPAAAQAVHGLSDAFLADKPRFGEIAEELIEFLGDCPLVAHNASFDFGFLNAELAACGRPAVDAARMVDTLELAKRLFPGAKHSLDSLCSRFGVDATHRTHHGALLDAHLLCHVYVELCGGRQITLTLVDDTACDPVPLPGGPAPAAGPRRQRVFAASDVELERHAAFLRTVDAPLWLAAPSG